MNKVNGYSLLEGLLSLNIILLVTLFLLPLVLQLFHNLNIKKEDTALFQAIYDESERLLRYPTETEVKLKQITIQSLKQDGRWRICATNKKKASCLPNN